MDEKLLEILSQFDCCVKSTYRGRGGVLCSTDRGTMILKEFHSSAGKLFDEYELKKQLIEYQFTLVDQHIKTKKGGFFAEDRYHTIFTMKQFFDGKECDLHNREEIKEAGINLALLHRATRKVEVSNRLQQQYIALDEVLERRTRELKRAKLYMESSTKKGNYEHLFLTYFLCFFEQANCAKKHYERIVKKEKLHVGICHGAYNQHNIIQAEKGIATINFEHFSYQNQLFDLHQILRKVIEKNGYTWELAESLLEGYREVLPLKQEEYQCLFALLLYPDKYFKLSNHYNSRRKSFISPKEVEKLEEVIEQNKKKEIFLKEYESQYQI